MPPRSARLPWPAPSSSRSAPSAAHAIAVPLSFAVALARSLGRAYGNAGASVGLSALSMHVIALGYPPELGSGAAPAALARAGFVVIGGAWAMLVALVLWPLRPYRPVRLAVGAD